MNDEEVPDGLTYLEIEDVLGLYADLFSCSEQEAADQLRNQSGLISALSRPQAYFYYQNADISTQAAALAHGIAEGQPFIEGNKRTALVSMRTFLRVNGYEIAATQAERAGWILRLSEGGTIEELAEHIRSRLIQWKDIRDG